LCKNKNTKIEQKEVKSKGVGMVSCDLKDLNGRHAGETIFIVGCGEQLGRLLASNSKIISALDRDCITIGCNSAFYAFTPYRDTVSI